MTEAEAVLADWTTGRLALWLFELTVKRSKPVVA